jgi:hypothetical protein
MFLPRSVFCRIYWQANDYGTTRWQLLVLQASTPLDTVQRVAGVLPGARLLLRAEDQAAVRAVLHQLDAIESLGIALPAVCPAYWSALGNRMQARLPLPEYTGQRHAAWLARSALQ